MSSPLLNNNDVFNAQRILFNIYSSHDNEFRIDEMAEVHKFMARFRTKFRVKWGFGFDDTLGDKIKITLLATGFGLDDIPELAKQHQIKRDLKTEEEQREEAERIAQEQRERDLLEKYGYKVNRRSLAEVVILSRDELDDNALIVELEDHPTYNRKLQDISRLRNDGAMDSFSTGGKTSFSSFHSDSGSNKKGNNSSSKISFK